MGRKNSKSRIPQRRKVYHAKKGGERLRHRRGRRWCLLCSHRYGVERVLRREVGDALGQVRGRHVACGAECPCLMCAGDSHPVGRFSDKEGGKRW